MWRIGIALAASVLSSQPGSQTSARFEHRNGDSVAHLDMPSQLPLANFAVSLSSGSEQSRSEFQYAPSRDFDCYWHQIFPMICKPASNARPDLDPSASDGRHLRAEPARDGVVRTLVYAGSGYAEFADFRAGRLEAFGFVDQETGATSNLWRRTQ